MTFSQKLIYSLILLFSLTTHAHSEHIQQDGQLIWADLYSSDVPASIDFYSNTFNWQVKKLSDENGSYHLFFDGNTPIAGLLDRQAKRTQTDNALWVGAFSNTNVEKAVSRSEAHDGTVILAAHNFITYGQRAVIADDQGGIFSLVDRTTSQYSEHAISKRWNWAQLLSPKPRQALTFYIASVEAEVEQSGENFLLAKNDFYTSGISPLPEGYEIRNRWINFLTVDNIAVTLKAVKDNGGNVIMLPSKENSSAIIKDPQGAVLGLIELEQ